MANTSQSQDVEHKGPKSNPLESRQSGSSDRPAQGGLDREMVRKSEVRQIEKAMDETTAQPASPTVRNAIEGNSLAPHQPDVDARHRRISEAAYRIAEARGFASGSELDDWLAAERDVDATDQERLAPASKPAPAKQGECAPDRAAAPAPEVPKVGSRDAPGG